MKNLNHFIETNSDVKLTIENTDGLFYFELYSKKFNTNGYMTSLDLVYIHLDKECKSWMI